MLKRVSLCSVLTVESAIESVMEEVALASNKECYEPDLGRKCQPIVSEIRELDLVLKGLVT